MKKDAQTGLCDKWCKGCKHRVSLANSKPFCCYILDTGHRRPNPAGDGCQMHTRLSDEAIRDEVSSGASDEDGSG